MNAIFFTGFPGFLGKSLLPNVLRRSKGHKAICLVQPKFAPLARKEAERIENQYPEFEGRIEIVEGDITKANLGMVAEACDPSNVSEIYHLAAIYDLSVGRDFAYSVNVDGTRNMLSFAEDCTNLERFQYVSTCYVSGRYAGIFSEKDLDKGQSFNNFYEETKFHAEVLVQEKMKQGMPATIYRPSIVVGDSQTGETQKYDGPYYVIQWLLRQPKIAVMPIVGDPDVARINVVPRDFVVDAISYLSGLKGTLGKVYQLADPNPLTVSEMVNSVGAACDRKVLRVPLPIGIAKHALNHVPGVYQLMQIPATLVDYMVHPTHYLTYQTQQDLKDSGIRVPHFEAYLPSLVGFVRSHPGLGATAMA